MTLLLQACETFSFGCWKPVQLTQKHVLASFGMSTRFILHDQIDVTFCFLLNIEPVRLKNQIFPVSR